MSIIEEKTLVGPVRNPYTMITYASFSARAESPDKILPDVSDESSDCIEVLEVVLKTNSSESEDDDHPPMVWRFSNCKENRRTVSEVATEISGLTSPNSSSTSEKANSKVSSESKIPNSSNTVIQSESGHPLRGRKRKYENQSREQRKLKANCNKRYISARGVEVLPKEFDRAFSCGCKKKCTELISPHRRENEIFTKFWALGNYEARCAFINAHVKQTSKKRSYVKGSSKRNFSRKYYFDNIEVCKMAFLRTLNVNQSRINAALQKVNDAKFADRRGEARGGWNALPTEKMEKVIDHIKKFPRHQLTLRRMYQLYCAEEIHPVSESTYRHVFYNKFNLRFKTTNKDSSDICNKFCVQNQTGISDEPLNLKISHKEHRKKLKT